jgi:hypothetical protein
MTRGRALGMGAPLLAMAIVALVFATRGGSSSNFQARATAVCSASTQALRSLPQKPASIAEGLEIEHGALTIFKREVSELQALGPQLNASFQAGLTDDRSLLAMFSSMLARPDFVRLALTLPGHPNLMPAWLKEWLARTHALQGDARTQFSQAGVPACEKTLS